MSTLRPVPAPSFYVETTPGTFESTAATVGPWGPTLQHGGPPCALVARAMERLPGGPPDARLSRVTIEILSPVPVAPLTIEATVLRPGRKIELVEATASAGGKPVLRARGWRLATVPGRSPMVEALPAPALPPPMPAQIFGGLDPFGYADAMEWRFFDGRFDTIGPASCFARLRVPLVLGEEPSAVVRTLVLLDAANGISAELDPRTFTFVPVDLSCALFAHPVGEWIGLTAHTSIGDDGIGLSRGIVFDQTRVVGRSLHTLWVEPRAGNGSAQMATLASPKGTVAVISKT